MVRKTAASARLHGQSTRSIRNSIIRNATAISTPAKAASGIRATSGASAEHHGQQNQSMKNRRQTSPRSRLDVGCRSSDHTGDGQAAEEGGNQVAHPLADQLLIVVGPRPLGQRVDDRGREQGFQRGEQKDRCRGRR